MKRSDRYPDSATTAELIFNEVLVDDCYGIRGLTGITHVLDIGANIGFFSMMARFLWPTAKILAVEPVPETNLLLRENTALLHIDTLEAALGMEPVQHLVRDGQSDGSNSTTSHGTGPPVKGRTLSELLHGLTAGSSEARYVVKLDCEGGERVLRDNDKDGLVLRYAAHWAMEYHTNRVGAPAKDFLEALKRIDRRATGRPSVDDRWLMWSEQQPKPEE